MVVTKKPTIAFLVGSATVALLCVFLVAMYKYAMDSPYRVNSEDAKAKVQKKEYDVILDVRTDLERNTLGFYPGSLHIQSADLATQAPLQIPEKNARILAYCNTGQRARAATEKLRELGYTRVNYIAGTYTTLV